MTSIIFWIEKSNENILAQGLASQMKQVMLATERYVKANYAVLNVSSSPTSHQLITINDLQSSDLLPATFTNNNLLDQTYNIYVLNINNSLKSLMVLIMTEGGQQTTSRINNVVVPSAARRLGSQGGHVPTGVLPNQSSNQAFGAYGTWSYDFIINSISNPGPGHLVSMLYLSSDNFAYSEQLHNIYIKGKPHLNTMFTDLDMSFNNINDVDKLSANIIKDTTKNRTLSQAVQDAKIVNNNEIIQKPTCPAGEIQEIFVTPVDFEISGSSKKYSLSGVKAEAIVSWSNWKVSIKVYVNGHLDSTASNNAKALVITKCT
ncbi:MAG: shufflon system plasmid conjugative transfer pilus tip adhesin PilV [Sedimenticola sp.]